MRLISVPVRLPILSLKHSDVIFFQEKFQNRVERLLVIEFSRHHRPGPCRHYAQYNARCDNKIRVHLLI